jgi:Glycosyltransferase
MKSLYGYLRTVYWSMPKGIKDVVRDPARNIALRLGGVRVMADPQRDVSPGPTDLSLDQFRKNVLAHAQHFRGVFVQNVMIGWAADLFQRPQHLAIAMAKRGYLVIYQTVRWTKDAVSGFRQVYPGVWVTDHDVAAEIPGAVVTTCSTDFLDRDLLGHLDRKSCRVVYEYIDHIDPKISGSSSQVAVLLRRKEKAFSGGADVIVATASALYDEAVGAVGREHVIFAPNGVNAAHYRRPSANESVSCEFEDFRRKHRAIVGYFGALAPWLWYDEVNRLTAERPDLGFVFIGPDYHGGRDHLQIRPNVLCTGPVDYQLLPAYGRQFDVCLIPFEPGEIAHTTSPLKLFEYFALEKPVVATSAMTECVRFPEVYAGSDAEDLSRQIDRALQVKDEPSFRARLAELADENDWNQRAGAYEQIFTGMAD